MTVKTAFKYIFIGLLTSFLLLVGYVVQEQASPSFT